MTLNLSAEEKQSLERQHKTERDGRIKDRIKAVLLASEGFSQVLISQVLRVHVDTVHDHLNQYINSKKLKPENGGKSSFLNEKQTDELINYLESKICLTTHQICDYVKSEFGVCYSVAGMNKWLKRHDFVYKKPQGQPARACGDCQAQFMEYYNKLLEIADEHEPILFGDAVHPSMATKLGYGWIRKGKVAPIKTTASKTRLNLLGFINLKNMHLTLKSYITINSESMVEHLHELRRQYPEAKRIHLILDQGGYNKSAITQQAAKKLGIILHFLPPYSPNLNPIERLWKLLNEHTRNNRYFPNCKVFRETILNFFEITWPQIAESMRQRINDNFQILKTAS